MDRRDFIQLGIGVAGPAMSSTGASSPLASAWIEATINDLQAAMSQGKTTARALTLHYLARIGAVDKRGPRINSIIELNPDAVSIATELDKRRAAKRPCGPLHGIPILLKDNICTRDRMSTSAGSPVLIGVTPPRDAFLAARLREAGAVILGKANLSEWANIRSTRSTSGWSSRGGLTRNPYALDRNTSGSSSGSAAAVAANLAVAAIGTETDGSIVSPASINGIVGIKPTVGLVSRNGIIPIAASQDTAGPMARTVADAVAILSVMAGVDTRDAATQSSMGKRVSDLTQFLIADGLRGARIGVARNFFGGSDLVKEVIEQALNVLRDRGAVLVDPVELPNADKYSKTELEVLLYELKAGLNAYLAEFADGAEVRSLKELIAYNERHRAKVMPYFGQEHFLAADAKGPLDSPDYLAALETSRRYSRQEGIDQVLTEHKLDALVAPTGGPAWLTDFINGDAETGSFSSPAAVAGYPHITVPAGFVHGLPIGLSLVGTAYSEPTLIRLAYGFEQATKHRRPPQFLKSAPV